MARNPLAPDPARDRKIKARAKELWEADGKPGCGPDAYMEQAADLIGMEANPHAGELPPDGPDTAGVPDIIDDGVAQEEIERR